MGSGRVEMTIDGECEDWWSQRSRRKEGKDWWAGVHLQRPVNPPTAPATSADKKERRW